MTLKIKRKAVVKKVMISGIFESQTLKMDNVLHYYGSVLQNEIEEIFKKINQLLVENNENNVENVF